MNISLDALGDGGQHGVVHDQVQTGQDQGAQDDGDQHGNRHIQRTLTGAVGQRLPPCSPASSRAFYLAAVQIEVLALTRVLRMKLAVFFLPVNKMIYLVRRGNRLYTECIGLLVVVENQVQGGGTEYGTNTGHHRRHRAVVSTFLSPSRQPMTRRMRNR